MTQANFIRQIPLTVPVDEVVQKAKAQGIKLKATRVRVVRSQMKRHLHLVPKTPVEKVRPGRPTGERALENDRKRMLQLIFKLGVQDTERLIEEARATVERVLR